MCRFPDERNEAILDVAKKRRITDQCKTEELLKASFSVMLKDPLAKGLTVTKPLLKWIAGTAVCEVINNTNLDIKVGPGEVIQRVYPVMMVEPSVSNNIIKEDWFSESRRLEILKLISIGYKEMGELWETKATDLITRFLDIFQLLLLGEPHRSVPRRTQD